MKSYKNLILLVFLFLILGSFGCIQKKSTTPDDEQTHSIQLLAQGQENTLEIATWNLKNFPLAGETSINRISTIIQQLDIDIYAVQEIEDVNGFDRLVNGLDEYEGLYSDDLYGSGDYQKTGIIYKGGFISILSKEMIFQNDANTFPRPPMILNILVQKGDTQFDFYLIIIHLKAHDNPEDIERRRLAAIALRDYMDQRIANEIEKDYIVAGDWNDEIDDALGENAFRVFINVPQSYRFLTESLAGNSQNASYIFLGSLIDHILISQDCFVEYQGGNTVTLRLDDQVAGYTTNISDHRPVMSVFPIF